VPAAQTDRMGVHMCRSSYARATRKTRTARPRWSDGGRRGRNCTAVRFRRRAYTEGGWRWGVAGVGMGGDDGSRRAVRCLHARTHADPQRTARTNVLDLCDEGTWVEYGALVIAGQRRRRSMQDLMENTPADGMLCGCVPRQCHTPSEARHLTLADLNWLSRDCGCAIRPTDKHAPPN
jgi:hypothetical protein